MLTSIATYGQQSQSHRLTMAKLSKPRHTSAAPGYFTPRAFPIASEKLQRPTSQASSKTSAAVTNASTTNAPGTWSVAQAKISTVNPFNPTYQLTLKNPLGEKTNITGEVMRSAIKSDMHKWASVSAEHRCSDSSRLQFCR